MTTTTILVVHFHQPMKELQQKGLGPTQALLGASSKVGQDDAGILQTGHLDDLPGTLQTTVVFRYVQKVLSIPSAIGQDNVDIGLQRRTQCTECIAWKPHGADFMVALRTTCAASSSSSSVISRQLQRKRLVVLQHWAKQQFIHF
jgi:hypothetical protein